MPPTTATARPVEAVEQRLFAVRAQFRTDPFARLVRAVHDDPVNAHNVERYLWVLEEAPPEPCDECGSLFLPSFNYDGAPAGGHARRYCSRRCAWRAAERRRHTPRRSRRRAA